MALSYNEYTGDGSLTTFTTPPYLEQSHIQVVVDGQVTTAYTLIGTSLTFNTAPENGLAIRIVRSSSSGQRLTDYADASLLTADTLDLDSNQLFYLTQEALDTASETNLQGASFYTSSTAVPENPTTGNLWFDVNTKTLKIYNGTEWTLAVPSNSSHKFETFNTDEAGYSWIALTSIDNSALVFLNGVKQVRSTTKEGLLTVPTTGDYFVDLTNSRIYFATINADSVVEVVVNLLNNTGNFFSGGSGDTTYIGGGAGAGSTLSLTQNESDGTWIITDSSTNISIVVADGNDGGVPIPTIVDNLDGTYTINNGFGGTATWRDGVDGEKPLRNIDYFDGNDGSYKSFIFNTAASRPITPTGGTFNGTVETFPTDWYDTPTASELDIEWVSTTRYSQVDGVWSNNGWSLPRLYFRQGADGAAGTSVTVKGTLANVNALVDITGGAILGDAYIIGSDLYVCTTASDDTEISDFTNVGVFVGQEGGSSYVHYAYANFVAGVIQNFSVDTATGRDYLGIYTQTVASDQAVPNDPTDSSLYTWQLIKGADGVSINWRGDYTFRDTQANSFEVLNAPLVNGMAYRDLTLKRSYIYQDGVYYQVAADGYSGTNGVDGMVWKGESILPPELPTYANGDTNHMAAANWAYRDIGEAFAGQVRIYDAIGEAWELMVTSGTDGRDGEDAEDGTDGLNVYVIYHDNDIETVPDLPHKSFIPFIGSASASTYPSEGWSTTASAGVNWMSQNTGRNNYTFDNAWSAPIRIAGANGVDGNHGTNGAGIFSGNMVASTYTQLQATAVVRSQAQRDPVIGDVVTLSEIDNRTNSVSKICTDVTELGNGVFTNTVALYVDGSLVVDGTIVGSKILAGTIDSTHITVDTLEASVIKVDTLDVGGKAISGSIGMINGTAGNDVSMSYLAEINEANFLTAQPQHIAGANHSDASVQQGDVMGGTPLYSFSFTTSNFSGTRNFIVTANLQPVGLFSQGGGSSSGFTMVVKATSTATDYTSTSASDYVTTRGHSRAGVPAGDSYSLSDVVSLSGNTSYYVWVFGVMDDVGIINNSSHLSGRGINNGQITVLGLNA